MNNPQVKIHNRLYTIQIHRFSDVFVLNVVLDVLNVVKTLWT